MNMMRNDQTGMRVADDAAPVGQAPETKAGAGSVTGAREVRAYNSFLNHSASNRNERFPDD